MSAGIGETSGMRGINVTGGMHAGAARQGARTSRQPARRLRLVWSAPSASGPDAAAAPPDEMSGAAGQPEPSLPSSPQRLADRAAQSAPVRRQAPVTRQAPLPRQAPVTRQAPLPRQAPVTRQAPLPGQAPVPRQAPHARSAQVTERARAGAGQAAAARRVPAPGLSAAVWQERPTATPARFTRPVTRAAHKARQVPARPAGLRLTRRGHVVLATFVTLVAAAAVTLVWLAAASGSTSSGHGTPGRSPYSGMTQIVVEPGQTLYSIATAAEPSASPSAVVQQIMDVNALNGTSIQAGQLLWVPQAGPRHGA
jgi:hypothetical protein